MLVKRTLSALILAPPFVASIWLGYPYFNIFICVLGMVSVAEVVLISNYQEGGKASTISILVGFISGTCFISFGDYELSLASFIFGGIIPIFSSKRNVINLLWMEFSYLYVVIACVSLIELRDLSEIGRQAVIWLFAVVWANDIGAYIIGRKFGSARITPQISPGKTWIGTFAGLFFAALVGWGIMPIFFKHEFIITLIYFSFIIAIGAQIGDFLESYFKRHFGVKNSGTIIPGHGGVLDRSDGILLTAPFMLFALILNPELTMLWK
jgi:phosphatidate cytidylyltransferase